MKKPTYNAVTLYTAEEMAQSSVNHGADAPAYKMTFDDGTNTAVYTFPRTKSGDVAVTSEIPVIEANPQGTATGTLSSIGIDGDIYEIQGGSAPSNMVTTDTDQSIYAGKYLRSNNYSGYGRISYSGLSYTSNSETSTISSSAATFRNSNNTTGYSTGYGMENISHRYKAGTSSLYKPFEISFTNETTSEVEGKYTFDNTKTGTVAVTSEIPTATSDLTNDSGFITSSSLPDMSNYYTKTDINTNYYDRTDVDDIVDNVADDIPEIFANQPNPTTPLTSLSINNTNYSIPAAQVNADWNAASGVAQILNKPTIPSTASSTSTVTPTTIQLTFTYSDNTTETVTLMTGATVSTTTTLS